MHNQNNKDKDNHNFSMMITMVACCLLPILIISFFGASLAGSQKWLALGAMAVFIIIHLVMMNRHHHECSDNKSDKSGHGNSHRHGCH